jgi:hypothetical protein
MTRTLSIALLQKVTKGKKGGGNGQVGRDSRMDGAGTRHAERGRARLYKMHAVHPRDKD